MSDTITMEEHRKTISTLMHRVKNNFQLILSLINLQSEFPSTAGISAEELNRRLLVRVHAIVLLQELLYRFHQEEIHDYDNLDPSHQYTRIDHLIRQLCDYGISVYENLSGKVNISVSGCSILMESHPAMSLTLIVNEVLLNALCHADGTQSNIQLDITGTEGSENFHLHCMQGPVGDLRLTAGKLESAGLGGLLIENYSSQLGGSVTYRMEAAVLHIDILIPTKHTIAMV